MAYSVARRHREFGLRMALGADSADIRRVVFRHAMAPILAGLGTGIIAGGGFAKGMSALLFHVSTLNPLAYPRGSPAPLYNSAQGGRGGSSSSTRSRRAIVRTDRRVET